MTPNHYQSHDKSVLSKLYQNITKNWLPELDKIFRFELYSIWVRTRQNLCPPGGVLRRKL